MVYVAPDGTIHENRPWSISRVSDYFWGVLNFVFAFFKTLINPGGDRAVAGGSGGRGRGGDGPGGPGGPGGGPRRRMGGITTIQDCSMPGGG